MSKTIEELERKVDDLRGEIFRLKQRSSISESAPRRVELREGEDLHDRTVRRIRKLAGIPPETNRQATGLAEVDEHTRKSPLFRRALRLFHGDARAAADFVQRARQPRKVWP
jgi:hypothetical protein